MVGEAEDVRIRIPVPQTPPVREVEHIVGATDALADQFQAGSVSPAEPVRVNVNIEQMA